VGAQDDVDLVDAVVDVDKKQVSEAVPRRLSVAACDVGGYSAARPGRTAIRRVTAENAVPAGEVGKGHDIVWVGRVDNHGTFSLVARRRAHVYDGGYAGQWLEHSIE